MDLHDLIVDNTRVRKLTIISLTFRAWSNTVKHSLAATSASFKLLQTISLGSKCTSFYFLVRLLDLLFENFVLSVDLPEFISLCHVHTHNLTDWVVEVVFFKWTLHFLLLFFIFLVLGLLSSVSSFLGCTLSASWPRDFTFMWLWTKLLSPGHLIRCSNIANDLETSGLANWKVTFLSRLHGLNTLTIRACLLVLLINMASISGLHTGLDIFILCQEFLQFWFGSVLVLCWLLYAAVVLWDLLWRWHVSPVPCFFRLMLVHESDGSSLFR